MNSTLITPPQSPIRSLGFESEATNMVMGTPKRVRPLCFDTCPSPPKRAIARSCGVPEWLPKVQGLVSPQTPVAAQNLTPLGMTKNGDQCRVKFYGSPMGPIVERTFFVGKSSKDNPKGVSPDGLKLVHPGDFEKQIKSLEMRLPHCLSPVGMMGEVEEGNNVLKVSQFFPAGIPLDDFVKENPMQCNVICQKWSNAIVETVRQSGKLVNDPKPQNAVVFKNEENGECEVKLIDFELVDEEDVDDFGDIISGRYFVGEESKDDIYTAAIEIGILDMQTGFSLEKEDLIRKYLENYKKIILV